MGLNFTDASSDKVDFGSPASLDNVSPCSWIMWMLPTSTANNYRGVVYKDTSHRINIDGSDGTTFLIFWQRATGGPSNDTKALSNSVLVANTWAYIGGGLNPGSGAFCFHGDVNTLATDQTASSQAGSATKKDESAGNYVIGGLEASFCLGMTVAFVAYFSAYLTIAQIQDLQFDPWNWGSHPNCIHATPVGLGRADAPDWSGNGNNGTVTGATLTGHVPIPLFPVTPSFITVSTGITQTVNQVTETDLSQALTRLKTKAVVQSSETELSQAFSSAKAASISQVSETDLSQTVAWAPKHRLLNQVLETGLSQVFSTLKSRIISQNIETDLSQAIAKVKNLSTAQVSETDLAQTILWAPKNRLVNQIVETDLSQNIIWAPKNRLVNLALETDLSQAFVKLKNKAIAQTVETDLSQVFSSLKTVTIIQVTETDLSQPITAGGAKIIPIDQVLETDIAQTILWSPKHRLVVQVLETDIVQPFGKLKSTGLLIATESDTAQLFNKSKNKGFLQVAETNIAQPVLWNPKIRLISQVSEIDAAIAVAAILGTLQLITDINFVLDSRDIAFSLQTRTITFVLNKREVTFDLEGLG